MCIAGTLQQFSLHMNSEELMILNYKTIQCNRVRFSCSQLPARITAVFGSVHYWPRTSMMATICWTCQFDAERFLGFERFISMVEYIGAWDEWIL
jgi:hypothetical protein